MPVQALTPYVISLSASVCALLILVEVSKFSVQLSDACQAPLPDPIGQVMARHSASRSVRHGAGCAETSHNPVLRLLT